jgi:pSer/pThr/pTyr-binding forkhead associated (FHA) protein
MTKQAPGGDAGPIDEVCNEFEAEWLAGRPPPIEPYLARVTPPQEDALLRELLALDVEYRLRRGERPGVGEYQRRFPAHAALVATVMSKAVPPISALAEGPKDGGTTALTLTAVEGPHKGQTFTFFGHDVFLVGRSKQAHLQMRDSYFSRTHFMIEMNPPDCRLTDMGSRNGTYVNGQRVQTADLRHGDRIKAGHTVLLIAIRMQAADPNSAAPLDTPTLGAVGEEVRQGTVIQSYVPPPPMADSRPVTLVETPVATPAEAAVETASVAAADSLPGSAVPIPPPDFPAVPGYRLVRELGRGGMGVVYLAEREADGTRVALKTVLPAVAANRGQVERFLREANILRELQHANIVCFKDMGQAASRFYFAMDYVEGTDAAKMLREHGPLPVRTAVRMICQLLSALDYAHSKGFVHRDIKPANLLVTEEGGKKLVKLADFGLARVYQASRMSGLTMQGDVGGTVAFMPPEQITQFRQVKPPTDQYSAAATLYTLVTGKLLFDFVPGAAPSLSIVLQEEPVPIRQRRPDIPEELASIIHRALAKEPASRYPDVRAFRAALTPFVK